MPTEQTVERLVESSFKKVMEARPELVELYDLNEEDFNRQKDIIRNVLQQCIASFDALVVAHALSLIFEDHVEYVANLSEDKMRAIMKRVVELAKEERELNN